MLAPTFTWLPLPYLPRVPEHFISQAQTTAQQLLNIDSANQGNRVIKHGNQFIPSRYRERFDMGPDWDQWVRSNLFEDFLDTSGRVSIGVSAIHGAHTDIPSKLRLYYLVDRGGESAETVFYLKPGSPLVYDMDNWAQDHLYEDDHDNLIEIDRVKFPLRSWILFNGCIIHGVEGITQPRLNLTVDIKPQDLAFQIRSIRS